MVEIPDPCVPNPCENEGFCAAELGTFECKCVPGFKGRTCEGMSYDFPPIIWKELTILRLLKPNVRRRPPPSVIEPMIVK